MRILASDYDGTLDAGGIDDRKREAIRRWRAQGNRFGIISGRNLDDLVFQAADNRLDCDFLIANNGAVTATADGTVLSDVRGAGEVAAQLIDRLFRRGIPAVRLGGARCGYIRAAGSSAPGDIPAELLPTLPYFYQISVELSAPQEALALAEQLHLSFGGAIDLHPNGKWLDIVPHSVDKAAALRQLAARLSVPTEKVIVVGDSTNDAGMLAAFPSYAMASALPSVQRLADAVTPGVAELIGRELAKQTAGAGLVR